MAKPSLAVRVQPEDGRWKVCQDGLDEPFSVHDDQNEATEAGREVANARNAEFFVYTPEGEILERADYRLEQRDEA